MPEFVCWYLRSSASICGFRLILRDLFFRAQSGVETPRSLRESLRDAVDEVGHK